MTSIETHPLLSVAWEAAGSWALSLVEPLMRLDERIVAEDGMRRVIERTPEWADFFFAGSLFSLLRSLPRNDPWRSLSARVPIAGRTGADQLIGFTPPRRGTGAMFASGATFGKASSSEDMLGEPIGSLDTDFGYAPLAGGLSPEAAALLAFCAYDVREGHKALRVLRANAVYAATMDVPTDVAEPDRWIAAQSGDVIFEIVTSAMRWAVHRRRLNLENQIIDVPDDAFIPTIGAELWPLEACRSWARRADALSAKAEWPDAEIAREIAAHALPDAD